MIQIFKTKKTKKRERKKLKNFKNVTLNVPDLHKSQTKRLFFTATSFKRVS